MTDMFVSYSRVNRDRITGVGDAIEESGHSVWTGRRRRAAILLAATPFSRVRIGRASLR